MKFNLNVIYFSDPSWLEGRPAWIGGIKEDGAIDYSLGNETGLCRLECNTVQTR